MPGISPMSTYYIEIRILPDPEFSAAYLMGALYAKLHRALVQMRTEGLGVSFPEYSLKPRGLGQVMRIHGALSELQGLEQTQWLRGMRDHIELKEVCPVPEGVKYRTVYRRQFKTNVDRLRRRRMKRHGETAEQAAAAIPDCVQQQPDLPFIQLRSQSTAQAFCLFLEMGPEQGGPVAGRFNAYGLSAEASVPWF